ncbi:5478_t:CDS:2 [Funneliformis caledonium]|uniref:Protein transport protein SEC22 n=2 Tax=Funneliformis TaxID=1117308 RepID=A0A9N9DXD8_9GLOM|nr:5478_t:CDS:2 [Funneliformis caledonium]
MVKYTVIARVSDGLPLAASVEDDQNGEAELADYKNKAKLLFKKMNENSEERCSIESGNYYFHYLIQQGVCYMTICERSYPRQFAFSYLEELAKEFSMSYGNEVEKRNLRPYAFVKFDTFMQKTKRVYQNTRTQHNLDRLNTELNEVANIMTKNLENVLWRGEGLEKMSSLSDQLRYESQKYKKSARDLNLQLLLRKYGPLVFIFIIILLVLYWRLWWY